ncbi:MAG: hotdog fold thioesterase [Actinomycetota bacterium]|nr:hotdog fold thioesterase [Actinomycetota bacterium]
MADDDLRALMQDNQGELNDKLGVTFRSVSRSEVVATMPVGGNRQPYGLLHGGASIALAETLGSTLAALNAPEGWQAVGVDMNATHHASATEGTVTGTATVISAGRTLVSSQVAITDETGRRLCTARLTCLLRAPRA